MPGSQTIGVVIAMQVELDHLLGAGTIHAHERSGPWSLWTFDIDSQPVVAIRSDIGMINAAAATEYVIGAFEPAAILNSGCTGAHVSTLAQGDVVIGTATVYHAAMQILENGSERHVGFAFETVSGDFKGAALPADPTLLELARSAARAIEFPIWSSALTWDSPEARRAVKVVEGPVASADVWTQQVTRLDHLHGLHGTLCEDMEAAAVNQIAARHGLPFLTVKDIINNERHAQTKLVQEAIGFEAEFPIQEAGRRSAILLAEVIRRFGTNR